MRILCLTARLPYPPIRGDRLRAYHFLKCFSRNHELHLLSFIANENEVEYIEELRKVCKDVQVVKMTKLVSVFTVATNLWRSLPLQVLYYRSKKMRQLIQEKLASDKYDAAYIHLFRMVQYLENTQGIYRIVDLTDVISREIARSMPYRNRLSRLLYTFEHPRIHQYERLVARHIEEVWLISEADRRELSKDCPVANIQVVTNGIDIGRFFPTGESPHPNSIIFTGHFGVAHNVDAARVLAYHVLPLVQQAIPNSTLTLVGAEPSREVIKLGNLHGVHVTGYVSDLNAFLNQNAVFAAPLRFSAGIQNKVLEAMAAARPVITSSIVNEGLGASPGEDIVIADTSQEMAHEIIRLFQQPADAHRIGYSAKKFVSNHYSWDYALGRVNKIAQSLE